MKTISAGLDAHLALDVTTLATCWKVTRADGSVFGFTDHDQDIEFPTGSPSFTYQAATGYTRSAIQTSGALNVDNLDLEGVFDSEAITEADLHAGLWDYATVEIFLVNWNDLTQGSLAERKGRLGNVRAGRQMYTAELRGLAQHLQQEIGRIYGPACNADLGDSRCGVVLTGSPPSQFVVTGAVTGVNGRRIFYDTSVTNETGFFDHGKVTWITGENAGLSMEVKTSVLGSPDTLITLQLPMPYDIAIGDAYTMHAGCDKSLATCLSKFNNVVNFRGFPHIPGVDQVISGGL